MVNNGLTEKEARLALRANPGERFPVALRYAMNIKKEEERLRKEEAVSVI